MLDILVFLLMTYLAFYTQSLVRVAAQYAVASAFGVTIYEIKMGDLEIYRRSGNVTDISIGIIPTINDLRIVYCYFEKLSLIRKLCYHASGAVANFLLVPIGFMVSGLLMGTGIIASIFAGMAIIFETLSKLLLLPDASPTFGSGIIFAQDLQTLPGLIYSNLSIVLVISIFSGMVAIVSFFVGCADLLPRRKSAGGRILSAIREHLFSNNEIAGDCLAFFSSVTSLSICSLILYNVLLR